MPGRSTPPTLTRPTRTAPQPAAGWHALLLALVLASSANVCLAKDQLKFLPDTGDANLTFYLDNDLFADTDQDYTNGARLSWISGSRDPNEFGRIQQLLRRLSSDPTERTMFSRLSGFADPTQLEYNYGFSVTQLMFTPDDPKLPEAPPGQRPYAGWLGVDFSLFVKDSHALNSVSLAIGTVGPHALAKQAQDLVHDIRGLEKFKGWDSQIPNEVTVNFYYGQKRRIVLIDPTDSRFAIDGFTEGTLALGTYFTGLGIGGLLRFGWNLPLDFADARLSVTSYAHQPFKDARQERSNWSAYGMVGVGTYAVAHNITLDGPVFRSFDTGTNSRPLVGEGYIGFGVRYRRWNFSYVHTFRSKEFSGQKDAQSFGSLSLGYRL